MRGGSAWTKRSPELLRRALCAAAAAVQRRPGKLSHGEANGGYWEAHREEGNAMECLAGGGEAGTAAHRRRRPAGPAGDRKSVV